MSGRVQRRQAEKYAGRDAQIYADRQQAYQQTVAPQAAPAPAAPAPTDRIEQLKQLAELHTQGVLTDEEFAAEKAKTLNS